MSNELGPVRSQSPAPEPPQRSSGISRIKFLRMITSSMPLKYQAILGAYGRAPQMPGEQLISEETRKHTKDIGETKEVDILVPDWWRNNREPIMRNNTLLLVRPEGQEAILVVPDSNSPSAVTIEELLSKPQSTTVTPPYKQEWQIIEGGLDTQTQTQPTENTSEFDALRESSPFFRKPAA